MPYKDPEKNKAYQREYAAKRRRDWFKGKTCARCSSIDRLKLSYKESDKATRNLWFLSKKRQEAELKKCWVLCHRCRTEKETTDTYGRAVWSHGTRAMYRRGCRCRRCKDAQRYYMQIYRGKLTVE